MGGLMNHKPNEYIIKDEYALIKVKYHNKIYYTKVDIDDLDLILNTCRWFAHPRKTDNYIINRYGEKLHRLITNCPKNLVVDHINGDTLDNRKSNLRIVSQVDNIKNRIRKISKLGKGISRNHSLYSAEMRIDGIRYRKNFKTLKEAIEYRRYLEAMANK